MLRAVGMVLLFVLIAGACGGSAGPESSAPSTAGATTSAPDPEAPEPAPEVSDPIPVDDRATTIDCDGFFGSAYEVRKADLEAQPDLREDLVLSCAQQLDRHDQAVELEERAASVRPEVALQQGGLRCKHDHKNEVDPVPAWNEVTNMTDQTLGIVYSIMVVSGTESGTQTPLVVRGLEPGDKVRLRGELPPVKASNPPLYECSMDWMVFVDDPSDIDIGMVAGEGAGVDVAQWFDDLLARQQNYIDSGDASLAASFEDIRSLGYATLVESAGGSSGVWAKVFVCEDSVVTDGDIAMFAYARLGADGLTHMRIGAFRQGFDGQWRWLGSPIGASSAQYSDCLAGSGF